MLQGESTAASTSRSLLVTHMSTGNVASDGGGYVPGDQYTVEVSSTSNEYMLEISTDAFTGFTTSSCEFAT